MRPLVSCLTLFFASGLLVFWACIIYEAVS